MLRAAFLACCTLALIPLGCTSLQRNYADPIPGPSLNPSSSPIASGSPEPCATQNPSATEVAMVSFITPTAEPTYGIINGYAVETDGSAPVVAEPIDVTPGTVVQFVNGEESGTPSIVHSAVGLGSAATFPPVPYTFAAAAAGAEGTQITSGTWSTGELQPGCYSQSFTVPSTGTYLFGDDDYYNLSNTRDYLTVTPTAATPSRRANPTLSRRAIPTLSR